MEQNTDEKTIIKDLFVSEEELIERLKSLVNLSKDLISIVEETGETMLGEVYNMNNNEKSFLFFLGAYFSHKAGLREKPEIGLMELANKLSVPVTTLPAPIKKLMERRILSKAGKGKYILDYDNYMKIKKFLFEMKKKQEKFGERR